MMQLKAIFSVLLLDWEFELAQPPDTYRNDHSKMVVQLQQPCAVRYRRRPLRPVGSGSTLMRVLRPPRISAKAMECASRSTDPCLELGKNPAVTTLNEHRLTKRFALQSKAAIRFCPTSRTSHHRGGVTNASLPTQRASQEMMERWMAI